MEQRSDPGERCRVGRGEAARCKTQKGSYTPAIRDRNQIRRIQTTGLGVLTRKPCHLRNRKVMCDHFLESLNGMSMNDTKILKTKTAEMGIRILFMINKRFHTIRYCYNYLQLCLLLLYSYYDSVTGGPLWVRHSGRHLGASLGITWYGPWTI